MLTDNLGMLIDRLKVLKDIFFLSRFNSPLWLKQTGPCFESANTSPLKDLSANYLTNHPGSSQQMVLCLSLDILTATCQCTVHSELSLSVTNEQPQYLFYNQAEKGK